MAKEPCEPYGSYDESEIWLPKYWHIKKVTDQIHIDELIKPAIVEDYSTFENHKILCACRIQEALIEIVRCFATAEREKSADDDAYRGDRPGGRLSRRILFQQGV